MLDTKQKGIVTELQCITYLNQLGYHISIPYGENSRYDFIVDIEGHLKRVQVKTSQEVDDGKTIQFICRTSRVNSKGVVNRRYTSSEIDYFATFYNGKCYLVPVNECSVSKKLRFEPASNNQTNFVNFAKDYEAEVQIGKILSQN